MSGCPKYRIRLFLSVDLVGSTSYKAGVGREIVRNTARQRWVDETRHFYREFPKYLEQQFRVFPTSGDLNDGLCPQIWKTVGDEIIFCARLDHLQRLGRCIWAFIRTLEVYSKYLEASSIELDVKGVAWIAAFPAPNVTVPVSSKHVESAEDESGLRDHEQTEIEADKEPSNFEFLGKEIDIGFRVAKHSGSNRLALSIEVAYLLSTLCARGDYNFIFTYSGRESLKGVIGSRPYPILAIDTERREHRRQVQAFEQALIGDKHAPPHLLESFLGAFMQDEKIEFPILTSKGSESAEENLPDSYRNFAVLWLAGNREDKQRIKVEEQSKEAEEVAEPDAESLAAIEASAQEVFKRFREPG